MTELFDVYVYIKTFLRGYANLMTISVQRHTFDPVKVVYKRL